MQIATQDVPLAPVLLGSSYWLIASKPNMEQTAYKAIKAEGIEPYLPQFLRRRVHARKVDHVPTPLFPGYLFVKTNTVHSYRAVRYARGVADINSSIDFGPRHISGVEIDRLRSREIGGYIKIDDSEIVAADTPYKEGETLQVVGFDAQNALTNTLVKFMKLKNSERAVVSMQLFGRTNQTEIDLVHLERWIEPDADSD